VKSAEYIELVAERLRADGSDVSEVELPVGPALVGYQSAFRVKWTVKIHLFTVVIAVQEATVDLLDALSSSALSYPAKAKGRFRGPVGRDALIPVLVGDSVSDKARDAAQERHHRFQAFELPVVVDLRTGTPYLFSGEFTTGWLWKDWIRERARAAIPPRPVAPWTKRGDRWFCLRHGLTDCEECPNRPVST
jgi:hypothetical protein